MLIKGRESERYMGYLFVLPLMLFLGVFIFYPTVATVCYSFTRWNGIKSPVWIGLQNFQRLLKDRIFWQALKNNITLALYIPIWLFVPLIIAALLHEEIRGWRFFKLVYFFPNILSPVIVGVLFGIILRLDGPVNAILEALGARGLVREWLGGITTVLPMVSFTMLWCMFGFGTIVFLAGLATVPQSYYDAANIDGAGWWQRLWYITLPCLRAVIEFWLVLCVITVFARMFSIIYVMTRGGPGYASYVLEFNIYMKAFRYLRMGYSCMLSTVLLLIILVVAVTQVWLMSKER